MRRDLCNDAKNGKRCIDDLCRTGGETLCGFDYDDYLDMSEESEPPVIEDEPEEYP